MTYDAQKKKQANKTIDRKRIKTLSKADLNV
jgi:hypothetical protein